jgi:EpsI family protein
MSRRTLTAAGFLILAVQAIASYSLRHDPFLPSPPPLMSFPFRLGNWTQIHDSPLEPEVLEALGPDDSLNRQYEPTGAPQRATLFVAYYRTQLRAKNAHDPKVCLPGGGWNPRDSRVISISLPDSQTSFPANYYRIAKGDEEEVVLYWFQTHKGVYTFEQQLHLHRVLDSILDNRTDMALVRIVVPVGANTVDGADARALQLARLVYPAMLPYFPANATRGGTKASDGE